jgi:broad specificity phosphatase PhoE
LSIEITFVRHGETDANAASIWQGQGDAGLSQIGQQQAAALGDRLGDRTYDFVVSSDLNRTLQTAALAGLDPSEDVSWREMDIGAWEGLSRTEVHDRFPDEIERLEAGDRDVRMGGGESWAEFGGRIAGAIDDLIVRIPAGSRVLVMAHGGVIHAALSERLGFPRGQRWPIARILNTAITEVVASEDEFHLQVLNDARHAPVVTGNEDDAGIPIALVRHGESEANVAGEWHGRTDGPLTAKGKQQGVDLAARYDGITRVFASPLRRTKETATAFAAPFDLEVDVAEGLIEIDFGAWEGLTTSEIGDRFPFEWHRVFTDGADLARGGTGETFAGVGARMESQIRTLADENPSHRMALFTHGGAIWAFATRTIGLGWKDWRALALPSNTSLTHVRFDGGSPVLMDYNLPA